MPPGVIYQKQSEASEYAKSLPPELAATVVGVDSNKDGNIDSWTVETKPFRHKGMDPDEFEDSGDIERQKAHLLELGKRGSPSSSPREGTEDPMAALDELGYRHGGMSFTARGPIRYSKGGAVKGKTFRGSF